MPQCTKQKSLKAWLDECGGEDELYCPTQTLVQLHRTSLEGARMANASQAIVKISKKSSRMVSQNCEAVTDRRGGGGSHPNLPMNVDWDAIKAAVGG